MSSYKVIFWKHKQTDTKTDWLKDNDKIQSPSPDLSIRRVKSMLVGKSSQPIENTLFIGYIINEFYIQNHVMPAKRMDYCIFIN